MAEYEGFKGKNPEIEEVDVDLNEASNIAQNYKPENDDVPPGGNAALWEQWKKEKEDIDKKQQIMTEIENEKDITKSEYYELSRNQKLTDAEVKQLVKYSIKNNDSILNLPRLEKITDEQAKCLSIVEGLRLGVENGITDKQAEILSNGNTLLLWLKGLTSITDKQAEILSNGNIRRLGFYGDGLTSITDKQAEEFAKLENLVIDSSILTPEQKDVLKDVILTPEQKNVLKDVIK